MTQGESRLIVDPMYKNPLIEHHGDRFRNTDLYQAFTYAAALDAPAVLVYPRVDWRVDVMLAFQRQRLRLCTVDLQKRSACFAAVGRSLVEEEQRVHDPMRR